MTASVSLNFGDAKFDADEFHTKLQMALTQEAAKLLDNSNYKVAIPLINRLKAEVVESELSGCGAAMRAYGAIGYIRKVDTAT